MQRIERAVKAYEASIASLNEPGKRKNVDHETIRATYAKYRLFAEALFSLPYNSIRRWRKKKNPSTEELLSLVRDLAKEDGNDRRRDAKGRFCKVGDA